MFEVIGVLLNSHPLLWVVVTALVGSMPVVAMVSYFLWAKETVGQRKKTDVYAPKDSGSIGHRKKTDVYTPGTTGTTGEDSGSVGQRKTDVYAPGTTDTTGEDSGSVGQRKKTDVYAADTTGKKYATDTTVKDGPAESGIHDSGIETSGETLRTSESPDSLDSDAKPNAAALPPSVPVSASVARRFNIPIDQPRRVIKRRLVMPPDDAPAEEVEERPLPSPVFSFPPVFEEFSVMDCDVDPMRLEAVLADPTLVEVKFRAVPGQGPPLGLSIGGGSDCSLGDLPIVVKGIRRNSLLDDLMYPMDELVAVNETFLVGATKGFAVETLEKMRGDVRILVLREY